jgi:SAM-dependent methyltransferase
MEAAHVDAQSSSSRLVCWCGCRDLHPYSVEYRACRSCGTLVSCAGLSGEEIPVRDDESDFYGKTYWLGHQTDELGLPDIVHRSRADVGERCMHWLRTLLRFKQPPARLLEVGCAHGGFVALARWAGYEATGLELSPWVVEFARKTFGIPMLQGTIEEQRLAEHSFDAVVLNDVLEHLADPIATMNCCARLLKEDGVLLVQTPCYPEKVSYEELQARKDRFMEMMHGLARQHLFLFSRRAVEHLLGGLGFAAIEFLPALFEYDMYFVAGRHAVTRSDLAELAARFAGSPEGRIKLAWFDFLIEFEAREFDRAARLEQILSLHDQLRQSEAAREVLQSEVHRLAGLCQLDSSHKEPPSGGWIRSLRRLLRAG